MTQRFQAEQRGGTMTGVAPLACRPCTKPPPIPSSVSKLMPPCQLERTLRYYGVYAKAIDRLKAFVPTIPSLGESELLRKPLASLHYYTDTIDYFAYEYDGDNTMQGFVRFFFFPEENGYRKFYLSEIKKIHSIKLSLVTVTEFA